MEPRPDEAASPPAEAPPPAAPPEAPAAPEAPAVAAPPPRRGCFGAIAHGVALVFPVASFALGFLWDALTLGRIDSWTDDLTVFAYLVALGGLLVVEMRLDDGRVKWPFLVRHAAWVTWLAQFVFGGLYSVYIVFYFRSAFSWVSFLFLAALFGLAVVNEFREHAVRSPRLRSALYWLAAYNFLLFMVPVVTGWIGRGLGLLATLFATAAAATVVRVGAGSGRAILRHLPGWAAVAGALALADLLGVIPPVPMALLDVGVFHDVQGSSKGYALTYDAPPWYWPFADDDRHFKARDGDKIWTYTRVFGPTGLEVQLTYVYERWTRADGWIEASRSSMKIRGGRDAGFRGYSYTRRVADGPWRVRVLLEDGWELGRYSFDVERVTGSDTPVRITRYDR